MCLYSNFKSKETNERYKLPIFSVLDGSIALHCYIKKGVNRSWKILSTILLNCIILKIAHVLQLKGRKCLSHNIRNYPVVMHRCRAQVYFITLKKTKHNRDALVLFNISMCTYM